LKDYFFFEKGFKQGPVDKDLLIELINSRKLIDTTLVWCEDFGSEWIELHKISELRNP